MTDPIKTIAVFLKPFRLPSFDETLPPGEYQIETRLLEPMDWIGSRIWASSVVVHLQPRASHPGLDRTLTVPLTDLEDASAKDKLSGKALSDYVLDEMLADPMIRLAMEADGVDEAELRDLYAPRTGTNPDSARKTQSAVETSPVPQGTQAGPKAGSSRPGIGE